MCQIHLQAEQHSMRYACPARQRSGLLSPYTGSLTNKYTCSQAAYPRYPAPYPPMAKSTVAMLPGWPQCTNHSGTPRVLKYSAAGVRAVRMPPAAARVYTALPKGRRVQKRVKVSNWRSKCRMAFIHCCGEASAMCTPSRIFSCWPHMAQRCSPAARQQRALLELRACHHGFESEARQWPLGRGQQFWRC